MSDLNPRLNAYRPDLADAALQGRVTAERFTAGRPAQVARGVAALRRRPATDAPQDTQLLSGEAVTVFDEAEGWAWVQNQTDGYVGYVESSALGTEASTTTHNVKALRSFLFPGPDLKLPPLDALTMTGRVAVTETEGAYSRAAFGGRRGWVYTRHLAPETEVEADFVATALRFLGVPYLWGGKASGGLDCSGLVQVALARAGIPCPRDSDMQAASLGAELPWQPGHTKPLPELRRGYLIYFPGHVAIALDAARVVSANAHAMMVSIEPLAELEARVKEESGGTGVIAVRRL
ncbi:MAG: C40 family peptidase [Alphaproteobacteria bacterium]